MIEAMCNQTATYWGPGEPDGFGGFTWPAKQEIDVRWQDKTQLVRSKSGDEKVSQAEVWSTTELELEGRLLFGTTTESDPPSEAKEPMAREQLVGLDGEGAGWKVFL